MSLNHWRTKNILCIELYDGSSFCRNKWNIQPFNLIVFPLSSKWSTQSLFLFVWLKCSWLCFLRSMNCWKEIMECVVNEVSFTTLSWVQEGHLYHSSPVETCFWLGQDFDSLRCPFSVCFLFNMWHEWIGLIGSQNSTNENQ